MRCVWPVLPVGLLVISLNNAMAQGTPDARQACAPDAMRLCSDFIPDVPKITKCMIAKYRYLSRDCRVAMRAAHRGYHRHHYYRRHHQAHSTNSAHHG
jgi:hypothetical protein